MKKLLFFLIVGVLVTFSDACYSQQASVSYRQQVSQYGITWLFEKPAQAGQFINGDWWVIGPVKIVRITPAPGPVHSDRTNIKVNH
jgi:hypothetical protein